MHLLNEDYGQDFTFTISFDSEWFFGEIYELEVQTPVVVLLQNKHLYVMQEV